MKRSKRKSNRIQRIEVPKLILTDTLINDPHVTFFQKIKGSLHLLEGPLKQFPKTNGIDDFSNFSKRFFVSKRIENLAKHKERANSNIHSARNYASEKSYQIPPALHTISNFPRLRSLQRTQVPEITKTISGTKLGALSSFHIMEEIQRQQMQNRKNQPFCYNRVKRLDSQGIQDVGELASKLNMRVNKRLRFDRTLARRKNSTEEALNLLHLGEPFVDKYKQYHMILMERNKFYTSRTLNLDYKNQWRL